MRAIRRDDFPLNGMKRVRAALGVPNNGDVDGFKDPKEGGIADLISCPNCLSLWVGIAWAAAYLVFPLGFWAASYALAFSTVSIFLSHANYVAEAAQRKAKRAK